MRLSLRGIPIRLTGATLVALLLSAGAVGYGGYDYVQQGNAIDDAVAVNATVTETDIEQTGGRGGIDYSVDVAFTYEYEGTEYTSDRLSPTTLSPTYETESKAESVIEPYETNETVTAYVDPSEPAKGFLEQRRTNSPFVISGGGALIFLLTLCHAAGARTPGQDTGIRPADEHEPTRYETLFGLARERVHRLSIRVMKLSLAVIVLAGLTTVGLIVATAESSVQVELTDPVGLVLLSGFGAVLTLIGGILLYLLWSFTEYRRLRERIPEPRPPSPFKRPTRLVTILSTNEGLDAYGQRAKRTGFALFILLFCLIFLLQFFL
jgi:hypothetical protein